jgi:hypothetical protein
MYYRIYNKYNYKNFIKKVELKLILSFIFILIFSLITFIQKHNNFYSKLNKSQ